jgi:hypothetical protein
MNIIIDKLFSEPYVESGIKQNEKFSNKILLKNIINVKNFLPFVIIMIILRIFNVNNNLTILIGIIVLITTIIYNNNELNKKILFLNNIIYNGEEEPFNLESYLELDHEIVNFYYENRWYINDNLRSYRKSLKATNNLLRIKYNLNENLMIYPENLYKNAYIEYKEALNELHSSIYKMTSHRINNEIFNDNLKKLERILKKHIDEIQKKIIKCGYNKYDINIWSIINPTNIEKENDIKTKNYSPHYSFF